MSLFGRLFGRISWTVGIVIGAFVLGFGSLVVYAIQVDSALKALAAGFLFALAAFLTGGLIGFLFGIPKSNTDSTAVVPVQKNIVRHNTNLEQISDWLTKILVGLTLVQFPAIGDAAGRLIDTVAGALGDDTGSPAFAGAVLVYFSVFGFIGGWLLTALRLPRAIEWAAGSEASYEAAQLVAAGKSKEGKAKFDEAVEQVKASPA